MEFKIENQIKLNDQIFDARYSPASENGLFAVVTIAGDVHLFEDTHLKTKLRKHHKGSSIRKARFTDDGRLVTIAKTVKVHDLVSNQTIHKLKRGDGSSTFYSVLPLDNNIIIAGDDDGGIIAWDTRTPAEPILSSNDCEQYISDIDGKQEGRKLIVCTSGEGTLTAYDLRAKKMIEPQSELFEAGFQCVKLVDFNKKVVVGGEDGAIYVFNHNEWAHTSGKFAINSDIQNRGKCSIDCIEFLPDSQIFLAGCSDGKMRSLTLWPHQIMSETILCKRSSLESLHVDPSGKSQILVSGENYINIVSYEEKDESDHEDESLSNNNKDASADSTESSTGSDVSMDEPQNETTKKLDVVNDDYLNVFGTK